MLDLISYLGRFVNWELNYGSDIIAKWIAAQSQDSEWKFLDVGCARANHALKYLAQVNLPYERHFGVEFNDEYIAIAKERLQVSKVDLETEKLPFEDCTLGIVIANQAITSRYRLYFERHIA
jgi:SAM-dependent methyltransferase